MWGGLLSVGRTRATMYCFFFQAEDGIRDLVRSRGLGDVYKRQIERRIGGIFFQVDRRADANREREQDRDGDYPQRTCLLYTSDAADERSSVDLGCRRIIKKKKNIKIQ